MDHPKRLSPKRIARTKALAGDVWLSDDDGSSGYGRLILRITRSDSRMFYFRRTQSGKTTTIPIGRYSKNAVEGKFTLSQARARARELALESNHCGPRAHRESEPASTSITPEGTLPRSSHVDASAESSGSVTTSVTLRAMCEEYVAFLKRRGAESVGQVGSHLERHVYPLDLAKQKAADVTSEQITVLVRGVIETAGRNAAKKIRSYLQTAYNKALGARTDPNTNPTLAVFAITQNPVLQVAPVTDANASRDRALADTELGHLLRYLDRDPGENSLEQIAIRLTLFLGGQRGEQLTRITSEHVNTAEKTVRLFDKKGRRTTPRVHDLPLVKSAEEQLRMLRERADVMGTELLFARKGDKDARIGIPELSGAIRKLSRVMSADGVLSAGFSYGDIRRTIETRMSELEISKEVRAQLQSHDLGGIQYANYNRYDFMKQKRSALLKWEDYLLDLKRESIEKFGL
jgi:hypothetical protein